MVEDRTVLILGAGASKPYGLPLGFELRDAVLAADRIWIPTGEGSGYAEPYEPERFDEFSHELAGSGFSSVDAFLEHRPVWTDLGKVAMSVCLLGSESRAKLFPPHQPRDHWHEVLWSRLSAPTWPGFKKQPIRIITFNYDRSLEHYLIRVITNNYGVSVDTAMRALSVLHVHGSLGVYDGSFGLPASTPSQVFDAANAIRVVHEADKGDAGFTRAREWVADAETVLFIGFGYHEANMKKLGFQSYKRPRPTDDRIVAGTHKGIQRRQWGGLCRRYGFSHEAETRGAGTISLFTSESLS